MNLAFYIARRYLFAKKSHNVINLISAISVFGVVVATIAMICTLSVFNGFKSLNTLLFSVFDPDLKITAVEGKVFDPTTEVMKRVCDLSEIQQFNGVLQENALVCYGDRQEISVLKGVDSTYRQLVQIDSAIIDGEFMLSESDFNYAVLGQGLAQMLGVNAAFVKPLEIYMPERTGTVNLANPATSFIKQYAFIKGVYRVYQQAYDEGFMLISIDLLRAMLSYDKEISALEIKLVPGTNVSSVKKKISHLIGGGFEVKDRFEQQEAFYKMTQIEKWVSYLMLCFILVLALFNVLGSLAILMIEKEEDVNKLRSMGANNSLINRIFLFEGWMISLLGSLIGVVIGIVLCFLQQYFEIIKLGEIEGTFIVDAYPVVVAWTDVLIVLLTVISIGFIAVLYPVYYLGKKRLTLGLTCCLSLLILMMGCGGQRKELSVDNKREIAVTIEPMCYFGSKIAGDDYTFFSVVPVGRSPETYDPTFREMIRVGNSEAFFYLNLLGVEQVLIKSIQQNQTSTRLFNLSEGMMFHEYEAEEIEEAEEMSGHHDHEGHDPHIWTSFKGAKVMSENIYKALASLDSLKSGDYKSNYLRLMNELEQLESELHQQLDTLSCRGFVIFHPALTYFAKEFNLIQYSIEEDGKDPSPATIKRLIEEARAAHVKVVFVQIEFDRSYADQIAKALDARIVTINPLDSNWDVQMKRIAHALMSNGLVDF